MITLICGPMYGGKSTMLIQKIERYTYANKRVAFVRPVRDNRGYVTHNGTMSVTNLLKETDCVFDIKEFTPDLVDELVNCFDAVFVDEYFMIQNCVMLCKEISKRDHNDIYFAGLLATSENELFTETINILPYCDEIIKLNGVCVGPDGKGCGSQHGNYSGYFGNAQKTSSILVGDNVYRCLCKKCYKKAFGKL